MSIEHAVKNILLTGGRAPVTLDLARKLHSVGCDIYVAESLTGHLCKYSRYVKASFLVPAPKFYPEQYIQSLCKIIVEQEIDLLIPTCEEIFYIARHQAKLMTASSRIRILVDEFSKLNMLHNKWVFVQQVQRMRLKVPATRLVTSQAAVENFLKQGQANQRFIVKPVYSRFAAKVIVWQYNQPVPMLDIAVDKPWIIQEFIEGRQYCSYAICHEGIVSGLAVYGVNFTAGRGACINFALTEHDGIYDWVKAFVADMHFTGQIAFDFIENRSGLYPLECNPRATSGLHLFSGEQLWSAVSGQTRNVILAAQDFKMLSMAMLFYAIGQCNTYQRFKEWRRIFLDSQDVVFRIDDPIPFFYQLLMIFNFYSIKHNEQISLLEATTFDIEWNGERLCEYL